MTAHEHRADRVSLAVYCRCGALRWLEAVAATDWTEPATDDGGSSQPVPTSSQPLSQPKCPVFWLLSQRPNRLANKHDVT
jgi:hypothetical protein